MNNTQLIIDTLCDYIVDVFEESNTNCYVNINIIYFSNMFLVLGETDSDVELNMMEISELFMSEYGNSLQLENSPSIVDHITYNKRDTYNRVLSGFVHLDRGVCSNVNNSGCSTTYIESFGDVCLYDSDCAFLDERFFRHSKNYYTSSFGNGKSLNSGRAEIYYLNRIANDLKKFGLLSSGTLTYNLGEFDIINPKGNIYPIEYIKNLVLDYYDFNIYDFVSQYYEKNSHSKTTLKKESTIIRDPQIHDLILY